MASRIQKLAGLVSAVFLMVGASGCVDYSSPEGVVRTSVTALRGEKVKRFRKTLRGEALDQYGSLAGMGELQKELSPFELKLGKTRLVREEKNARGETNFREFVLEVLGRENAGKTEKNSAPYRLFKRVAVECDVDYVWVRDMSTADPVCTGGNTVGCRPFPSSMGQRIREEVQRCYVTRLISLKAVE